MLCTIIRQTSVCITFIILAWKEASEKLVTKFYLYMHEQSQVKDLKNNNNKRKFIYYKQFKRYFSESKHSI